MGSVIGTTKRKAAKRVFFKPAQGFASFCPYKQGTKILTSDPLDTVTDPKEKIPDLAFLHPYDSRLWREEVRQHLVRISRIYRP